MTMEFRQVPSLARLLDTRLTVEVVDGEPTNYDDLLSVTISIPTSEFTKLTGDAVENLYLRRMIDALALKINGFGKVVTGEIPIPKGEMAWLCTNGKIPVLLRIVRREDPDRHQILIHALVQKVEDDD